MIGGLIQQTGSGLCGSARPRFWEYSHEMPRYRTRSVVHMVSRYSYDKPSAQICGEQSPVGALIIACAVTML